MHRLITETCQSKIIISLLYDETKYNLEQTDTVVSFQEFCAHFVKRTKAK